MIKIGDEVTIKVTNGHNPKLEIIEDSSLATFSVTLDTLEGRKFFVIACAGTTCDICTDKKVLPYSISYYRVPLSCVSKVRQESVCPIVDKVVDKFNKRAEMGVMKYGVNADRDDLSFLEWLNHLQEELMDATIYIEKIMKEHTK